MLKSLFAAILVVASTAAHGACSVTLSSPSGNQYSSLDLATFVEKEMRPRLNVEQGSFHIGIQKRCDATPPKSIALTIDQTDYYITAINDHSLTKEESTYQTSDVALDTLHFETAIDDAAVIDSISLDHVQNAVKTLAFFLAETARFAEVETIGSSILRTGCGARWISYVTLVRRWSVLSRFQEKKGIPGWTARGGVSGQLLAPVGAAVVDQYNQAIEAGASGPDYQLIDHRDVGHPIEVPAPICVTP